jgi:hypothetical protein
MRFDLKRPCGDCPFRNDRGPFGLLAERVREILGGGERRAWFPAVSFACHQTISYNDDGDSKAVAKSQHCAGVMLILHRENRPNDAMQLAERLGFWNPASLDADAPVYASTEDAIKGIPHARDRRHSQTRRRR